MKNVINQTPFSTVADVKALSREPVSELELKRSDDLNFILLFATLLCVGAVFGAYSAIILYSHTPAGAASVLSQMSMGMVGATFGMLVAGLMDVLIRGSLDDCPDAEFN